MIFENDTTYRCWGYVVGVLDSARFAWNRYSPNRAAAQIQDYALEEFEERLLYSVTPMAVAIGAAAPTASTHLPTRFSRTPPRTLPTTRSMREAVRWRRVLHNRNRQPMGRDGLPTPSAVVDTTSTTLIQANHGSDSAKHGSDREDRLDRRQPGRSRRVGPGGRAGTVVIGYNSTSDTATQVLDRVIVASTRSHEQIASLTILSHGDPGQFELGNQWVSTQTIGGLQSEWQALGRRLQSQGSIYIFSCDTGQTAAGGQVLVNQLAQLTGASVFATDNITGAGGGWNLDVASAGAAPRLAAGLDVPLNSQILAGYQYNLNAPIVTLNATTAGYVANSSPITLAPPSRSAAAPPIKPRPPCPLPATTSAARTISRLPALRHYRQL